VVGVGWRARGSDDMTFQNLEDRLNAGGMGISRAASKRRGGNAMWFGAGIRAMDPHMFDALDEANMLWESDFLVTKMTSFREAREGAAGIKDVAQRPAFAWGPFVFQGKQEVLDGVKKALEK
jgi:hypothetical protein